MKGGSRAGSGRKAVPPERKRRRIDIHVAAETPERIRQLRKYGVVIGRKVDELVENLSIEHHLL